MKHYQACADREGEKGWRMLSPVPPLAQSSESLGRMSMAFLHRHRTEEDVTTSSYTRSSSGAIVALSFGWAWA